MYLTPPRIPLARLRTAKTVRRRALAGPLDGMTLTARAARLAQLAQLARLARLATTT